MKKKFGFPFRKLFSKYLCAFIVILLPALASYAIFYAISLNTIKASIIENKINDIARCAADMDRNLYDLKKMILYYPRNSNLLQVDGKDQKDPYDYWILKQYNEQYSLSIPIVDDIFFYLPKEDLIITASGSFHFDRFFDKYMFHPVRNKHFWREFLDTSTKEQIFPADPYTVDNFASAPYAVSEIAIVTAKNTFKSMRLVILLSGDRIGSLYGHNFLIVDSAGVPLYSNLRERVSTEGMLEKMRSSGLPVSNTAYDSGPQGYVFFAASLSYPWFYVKIVPYDEIFGNLYNFNRIIAAVILFLFLVSMALSYYFSRRLSSPLAGITNMLSTVFTSQRYRRYTEEQKIIHYIKSISADYESIVKKYAIMKTGYRDFIFGKMISDSTVCENGRLLQELNIVSDTFTAFIAVYCRILFAPHGESAAAERIQTVVREAVRSTTGTRDCHCLRIDGDSFLLIVTVKIGGYITEDLRNRMLTVLGKNAARWRVVISVSDVFHAIGEIKRAYDDALCLFRHHTLKRESQCMAHGSAMPPSPSDPQDLREKARCLVKLGKYGELPGVFTGLLEECERQERPMLSVKSAFERLFMSIMEADDGRTDFGRFASLYKEIESCETTEEFGSLAQKMVALVSETDGGQDGAAMAGHPIVEKIRRDIQDNYRCHDLSLRYFADKYKMSPIYLSKIFKEHKKVNYSDYLTEVRMEKARSILGQEDIKIKDLCSQVGYRSPTIFIKAFRKRYGVSPGEYKRLTAAS